MSFYFLSNVFVATSDLTEQWLVFQRGAIRKSANELWKDIKAANNRNKIDTKLYQTASGRRSSPFKEHDEKPLRQLYWEMVDRELRKHKK